MTMVEATHQHWIGRTETRTGCLTVDLAGMLAGALGHAAAPVPDLAPGAPMPPLWHWAAFPEFVPLSELGSDGHPRLGGFLPPLPYSRRMWAGGRLRFEGRFAIGEALHKRSEILAVDEKQGATGPMVFVRVGHRIEGAAGGVIEEEQDIVYLDIPETFTPPRKLPLPEAPAFDECVVVNEARLFRYSAATYNAHRIHYDLPYAREVEKYPSLVVHGPMQASLVMEAGLRHVGGAPRAFRFRGVHPMFADEDMRLIGTRTEDGAVELCTGTPSGHQCLQARLEVA
ncbi:MaoC family dehydratase N-terminal domain-containing protein [Rhodovulum tesquicola]|uniref:FAS1-like dehydratase domain-containing protein n=1 Tax=Rhodovulum tesquicola TaxID=540254 RepID=UPI0020973B6F|nr:MaoC family dehydratase N-terminal domain-containing protein [Rhodovulum tesquicola]MCO8146607.1 MaoC family dehydratase N-terminal domain-containing protein [Rhodovulum tesquicola]